MGLVNKEWSVVLVNGTTAFMFARLSHPDLDSHPRASIPSSVPISPSAFKIQFVDLPHALGLDLVDHQFLGGPVDVVILAMVGRDVLALASCGRHLVASSFVMISRSNWANESRMLSVSRPCSMVVLNCWVTETIDTQSYPACP